MSNKTKLPFMLLIVLILISCNQQAEQPTKEEKPSETVNLDDFTSMQMTGVEQITVDVDLDGAVKHLSKALTFPTISNQDRNNFDTKAFTDYHKFLEQAYPNVYKKLK